MDGTDGRVVSRAEEVAEDPPNVMAFASHTWLLHGSDDANVRCLSPTDGAVLHTHAVTAPAEAGKRVRCAPVDHLAVLHGEPAAYVAAAGRTVHAVAIEHGELQHALALASSVRAMCVAPASQAAEWAYAIACAGEVRLISRAGDALCDPWRSRSGSLTGSPGGCQCVRRGSNFEILSGKNSLLDMVTTAVPSADVASDASRHL